MLFVLSKQGENGLYRNLYDEVHIDEKWFYVTSANQRVILAGNEPDLHYTTRHKSHIEKVMFLCAVARPRYDYHTRHVWDGKIGIWPVGRIVPAARNSRNRPAGTPVWKNENMDRARYTSMLVDLVFPAIKEKFPVGDQAKYRIKLQQDNATVHVSSTDPTIVAALEELQLNVEVTHQPPNSPDLNINDLAFFRSIQSLQQREATNNTTQLIAAVHQAFNKYPGYKIDNAFLTLQCCFNSIIERDGNNDYRIVHMNKARLNRLGLLPVSIRVTDVVANWDLQEEEMVEEEQN